MIVVLILGINKFFEGYEYNYHFNFFVYLFFEALTIFLFLTGISFLRSLALMIVYRIVSFVILLILLISVMYFTDIEPLKDIDESIKNFDINKEYNMDKIENLVPKLPGKQFPDATK